LTEGDTSVIRAAGLSKRYGKRLAVDDVSFEVGAGEIYGFLGPNGAGKTTTILMLMGILEPDAGEARIGGTRVRRGDLAMRRSVGAVSEQPYLYGDLTVHGYLQFFASLYAVPEPARRIASVLDDVGLADRANDRAMELSKGLQQKLSLARALVHDPPVLILDEPASGLDPHATREFREMLVRERERGRSILLSSHVLSEIERTADRVGIMRGGRLVAEGPTMSVIREISDAVELLVELDGMATAHVERLRGLPGVVSVDAVGPELRIGLADQRDARRIVARELAAAGAVILRMEERLPTLEDAFVAITDRDRAEPLGPGHSGEGP
jgi:ABC-2 type transport system ATP-binding protein